MQLKTEEIRLAGATLLSISPMLKNITDLLVKKLGLQFPVLCDQRNSVAKSFGLVFTVAESLQPIYSKFGIDLVKANGDSSQQLPLPATYIIDDRGMITYSFVDADHTTRLDPEIMIEQVMRLKQTSR